MGRAIRILFGGVLLLLVASFATCYFGVGHAIRQQYPNGVPPGQDTDWIGVEWIGRGMILMLVAIVAINHCLRTVALSELQKKKGSSF